MKKKTNWKTFAGLTAAALAFLKLSEDLPIHDIIPPYKIPEAPTCGRFLYAKWDSEARVWRCVPKGLL